MRRIWQVKVTGDSPKNKNALFKYDELLELALEPKFLRAVNGEKVRGRSLPVRIYPEKLPSTPKWRKTSLHRHDSSSRHVEQCNVPIAPVKIGNGQPCAKTEKNELM